MHGFSPVNKWTEGFHRGMFGDTLNRYIECQ